MCMNVLQSSSDFWIGVRHGLVVGGLDAMFPGKWSRARIPARRLTYQAPHLRIGLVAIEMRGTVRCCLTVPQQLTDPFGTIKNQKE